MLQIIPQLLGPAQLDKVHATLAELPAVAGTRSAGRSAARVKHNQELQPDPERMQRLARIIMSALGHHPVFRAAALPERVADPIFARYRAGMHYGEHVDEPIMGGSGGRMRSDLALTLWLSPADDYDGGELVIRTSFGAQRVRGEAGDAVLYPASSLHQVAPVTRGERLVAVTWIQSLVRDPARRELLYELGQARATLLERAPDDPATQWVDRSYVNLLRMWAEPG
ncbi:Fe2+-dependent dioxygenase [Marichromatium bheemlicum]|uniref:Fe2+-dependent dioxygenase n=1 Tax=Marichromatium bheemlicum TaxID=365339 RepID=A0ABX1I904_9GAMM|nr:Fe2+-dependent dioxygenase [Marichromatium bheemlicum]NKN33676.1 Fe2+-dependent dioxygenase [Marichromatium bheemlicum]